MINFFLHLCFVFACFNRFSIFYKYKPLYFLLQNPIISKLFCMKPGPLSKYKLTHKFRNILTFIFLLSVDEHKSYISSSLTSDIPT